MTLAGGVRALRRFSIRSRLTAGALVIAGVFFVGTAFAVHHQVEAILTNSSILMLQNDSSLFEEQIADGRGAELDRPAQGQLVAVIDPGGAVRMSTFPAELEPKLGVLTGGGAQPQTVKTPAAEYLVLARTVAAPGGQWRVVTARNEAASRLSLDSLTRALAIGLVILTLLFGVGSWVLASAALRPVSAMRRTAEKLRAGDRLRSVGSTGEAPELLPVGPAEDELSELAMTLNALIVQLRASADREKQLVSDASHELRTPLAILQAQLELAHLSAGDADALLSEIESAEHTVKRLSVLAAGLLELTRIEAGQEHDSTPVTEMADEVVDAVGRARTLSAGTAVQVDYSTAGNIVGTMGRVALSPHNFGRIIDNLLGNALAALSTTGVTSPTADPARPRAEGTVIVSLSLPRANALRLEVSDTGPGMTPEFLPLAFDRFARQDSSRAARGRPTGSGLGLSIVAALVASAGGTVSIANRIPSGLSVVIELPVALDTP
ncbi:ATP-binding protein [soil metagenome]